MDIQKYHSDRKLYIPYTVQELARKNTHRVPKDKIEIMISRYERGLTVEQLQERYGIKRVEPEKEKAPPVASQHNGEDIFISDDEDDDDDDPPEFNHGARDTGARDSSYSHGLQFSDIREDKAIPGSPEDKAAVDVGVPAAAAVPHLSAYFNGMDITNAESVNYAGQQQVPWESNEKVSSWQDENDLSVPKPIRKPRPSRRKGRKNEKDMAPLALKKKPAEKIDPAFQAAAALHISEEENEPKMTFSMDPLFAVQLQEAFGSPLEDSLLQYLKTDEILTAKIPHSLAHQFFLCWQTSLKEYLSTKPDDATSKQQDMAMEPQCPKTVLAPNAVEYYEKQMLDRVLQQSRESASPKKVTGVLLLYPFNRLISWACRDKKNSTRKRELPIFLP